MQRSTLVGLIILAIAIVILVAVILIRLMPMPQDSGTMNEEQRLIIEHPTNASVFAGWCEGAPTVDSIDGVDTFQLGTHPDLVDYFWETGQTNATEGIDPRRVICGRPGLVHPETGVIYGLATGTSGFFLRLPDGNNDHAAQYGTYWSSVETFGEEAENGSATAYLFAGT